MIKVLFATVVVANFIGVAPAFAQTPEENKSRWGVSFSATPRWDTFGPVKKLSTAETLDLHGSEFTIGIIRGSDNGGDWGISLVRRTVASDSSVSIVTRTHEIGGFFEEPRFFYDTIAHSLQSATMTGLEVSKYTPFLKTRRVQAGVTFAAGFAKASGMTVSVYTTYDNGPNQNWSDPVPRVETRELPAKEVFKDTLSLSSPLPIGRLEATVGIRATSQLKMKVGGGIAFPGKAVFRVGVNYLF